MRTMLIGVIVLSLFVAVGCEKAKVSDEPGAAEKTAVGAVPSINVASVTIDEKNWSPIEIAASQEEREAGLGERDSLAANSGMLFIFPDPPGEVTDAFWMKDMKFNLDMIFINKNREVVFIVRDAPAGSAELIEPPAQYLYVFEANAGDAADINIGDQMTLGMP